ncbi:MAG: ATP-binding protein [Nitrososphaerota archaeon]
MLEKRVESVKLLEQLEEVGVVVGESSTLGFVFSVHSSLSERVPRLEYVVAPLAKGYVLAQVQGVAAYSSLLRKELDYEALTRLTTRMVEERKHWREARVLAYIEDLGGVSPGYKRVKYAVTPGTPVYLAPDSLLSNIYSGSGKRLRVGHLVTRPGVEIGLSASGLRRHLAIIAQTGAGKSYLAGVLMEELLESGGTIIVLDPHADYVRLTIPNDSWPAEIADRVSVYKTATSMSRYTGVRNVRALSICFTDLDLKEIFYIGGIEERFTNIRYVIAQAYNELMKERSGSFTISDLQDRLHNLSQREDLDSSIRERAFRASLYVEKLEGLGVFGDRTTKISEMLAPKRLSVIDLSGLSDREADLVAYKLLKGIFSEKTRPEGSGYRYPVFIFIEEAHRFVPPDSAGATWSSPLIKRIAAEGRKFGVFLILISQRPSKLHPDVLSQCSSQIIMRITNPVDQRAVVEASERLGEELLADLPGLDKGEAVVIGDVINFPAIISVRKRRSLEGGGDIDVDALLDEATRYSEMEEEDARRRKGDWDELRRGLAGE